MLAHVCNVLWHTVDGDEEGLQVLPLPFQFEEQHLGRCVSKEVVQDDDVIQHEAFLQLTVCLVLGKQSLDVLESVEVIMKLLHV